MSQSLPVVLCHDWEDLVMDLTFMAVGCERRWTVGVRPPAARSVSLTMLYRSKTLRVL